MIGQEKRDKWKKILPELLAVILCLVLMGAGVSRKEGYHMDELLSFELANARYNPWIVPTQPEGRLAKFVNEEIEGDSAGEALENLKNTVTDVLRNRGNSKLLSYKADVYEEPVWITDRQFQDYVTVDQKDAFDYLSVYFNVKDDNHPPVHFMLLHTMSSVFRGTLSPWLGCSINLVCLGITLWLLLRLGRQLADVFSLEGKGRQLGILAVLLYGMSTGALGTVLLIRMYGLLSCLCVALFSVHVEKWKNNGFDKKNKGLIAITVLGFLTQYFFLVLLPSAGGGYRSDPAVPAQERRIMVLYPVHGDRCSDRTGIVPFCNFGCVLQRKRDGSSRQSGLRICRLRTETGCIWQNSGGSDSGSTSSDRRMCRRRNPASGKAVSELPGRETGTER